MFNFLALLDIRVFGRLYLWLLIGLALFLQPGCFCLALQLQGTSWFESGQSPYILFRQTIIMPCNYYCLVSYSRWLREQVGCYYQ